MKPQYWTNPVDIALNATHHRTITATNFAAECLLVFWPREVSGPAYQEAKRRCLDALDGKCSVNDAREAFIEAAIEAKILETLH